MDNLRTQTLRIDKHPVLGDAPTCDDVPFTFDGVEYLGQAGEPIAAALLANGVRLLRRHEESGAPRGIYCAIGHCMECRVHVEGLGTVRACITPLETDMKVTSGSQLPNAITGRNL